MKYFIKSAKTKKFFKLQTTDNLEAADFVPAAATGLAYKNFKNLHKSIESAHSNLNEWEASLKPYRDIANKRQLTFTEAEEAVNAYITGGQKLGKTKIMGIPGGSIMQKARYISEYIPAKLSKDPGRIHSAKKSVEHYNYFKNVEKPIGETLSHFVEKAMYGADVPDDFRNFSEKAKSVIFDNNLDSLSKRYNKLLSSGLHSDAYKFRTLFVGKSRGKTKIIGEAARLAGNASSVMSTPEVYTRNIKEFTLPLKRGFNTTGKILGLTTAALVALPLYKEFKRRKELKKLSSKKDSYKNIPETSDIRGAASAGLVGISIVGAESGIKKYLKPNKNIGVTYGEMKNIGLGHKAPADAIINILQKDKRFKDFGIERLNRDVHGLYRGTYKKYNTIINTGLGMDADWPLLGTRYTHGVKLPKNTKALSTLNYLTDLPKRNFGAGGSTIRRGKKILSYGGEHYTKLLKEMGTKPIAVSEGMTPAIPKNIVENITKSKNREKILADLEQFVDIPNISKHLKNKKLITVAGSGRGDFVAIRAKELSNALIKNNMQKDYKVVALMAGQMGTPAEDILKNTDVIKVKKLPRHLYSNLQGISEINWGSTGASGLAESLLHKNIQAIPSEWGYKGGKTIKPGSIADRQYKALGKFVQDLNSNLDDWNAGNIEYALKQPGVLKANKADDIINTLKDQKKFTKLTTEAKELRAPKQLENYIKGNKNFADAIYKNVKSIIKKQKLKGAGLAIAGTAGILYGLKNLGMLKLKNQKK